MIFSISKLVEYTIFTYSTFLAQQVICPNKSIIFNSDTHSPQTCNKTWSPPLVNIPMPCPFSHLNISKSEYKTNVMLFVLYLQFYNLLEDTYNGCTQAERPLIRHLILLVSLSGQPAIVKSI